MYEIRIHGRGGQGAVMASAILAQALVSEGRFAVAVPAFGFERRGAPVSACLRVDDREIRSLTNIYSPDCLICIDPTVARAVDIFAGFKPGGTLVQATSKPAEEIHLAVRVDRLGLCDAVGIALDIFGRPITNSIMLGAFARTTGMVALSSLQDALETAEFRDAGLEQNRRAMERGFAETRVHDFSQRMAS